MRASLDALTAREREVLQLMALGLSSKTIAGRLGIADKTTGMHSHNIYAKLHVVNKTEAVVKGVWLGIVTIAGLSPVAQAIMQLLVLKPDAIDELIEAGIIQR